MELQRDDYNLVKQKLGREPNRVEEAVFVNLWSEHCAYRSSRMHLAKLPTQANHVVVGPGDDAAVIEFQGNTCLAMGIESHNHPSYVDPYDGAATGVGGIVRDILSMGADPIALMDSIYFGDFNDERNRYLFEGVVDGISNYGNSIGVPTIGGQTYYDPSYNGNPLVNVACIGIVDRDEILTAEIQSPGNKLVLVGSSTGRDGLGGASFASEDLGEDAEEEDRPAVQVGDPYTEKLLIEACREIKHHALSCRDLGAAGLAGASSEMAAKGGHGVRIDLDSVHLRESGMNALEILLSESQERMLFEVKPSDVDVVRGLAERYDLDSSVIGDVTSDGFKVEKNGEVVVDLPAMLVADGAPPNDLDSESGNRQVVKRSWEFGFDGVLDLLSDPNNASKRWVYRQYDHEVQTRTVLKPGDDAAALDIDGDGLLLSSGCDSRRVAIDPYNGGGEAVYENALNIAVKGGECLALVNCLNFGNPENPDIYHEFIEATRGLGDMARRLDIPVVGGNVSLYNESEQTGTAVNPTPTIAVIGKTDRAHPPTKEVTRRGDDLVLVSTDKEKPSMSLERVREAALHRSVSATHTASNGGLIAALAEMTGGHGADVEIPSDPFTEEPGNAVLATNQSEKLMDALGMLDAEVIGRVGEPGLRLTMGSEVVSVPRNEINRARRFIEDEMQ